MEHIILRLGWVAKRGVLWLITCKRLVLVTEGTPDSKSKPPPTVKNDSDDVIHHGRGLLGISGFPVTGKPGRIAKTRQRG